MTAPGDDEHYTMVIQWSDADRAYLVTLPEWRDCLVGRAVTHGATYEEAARNGRDMLELLIAGMRAEGKPLPGSGPFVTSR